MNKLIFATRPSRLARWQTGHVIASLTAAWEGLACEQVVITTQGDRILDRPLPLIGGKGLFTQELELALREGRVHAAVHSLKDLPVEDSPGLTVGVIPQRADVRDVLICPAGHTLQELPPGATIGTSSVRRKAQLLALRPDLNIVDIRGNVDTRLRKVTAGQYDAILLAAAGVTRLGLGQHITQYLPTDQFLPAPGQGALAVQCRRDDTETLELLKVIEHLPTQMAVSAERAFLSALGGGCSLPIGASAVYVDQTVKLKAVVASPDGKALIHLSAKGRDPQNVGRLLAQQAIEKGAQKIIA